MKTNAHRISAFSFIGYLCAADNHPGDQEPPVVPEESANRDDRRVPDQRANDRYERPLAKLGGDHGHYTGGPQAWRRYEAHRADPRPGEHGAGRH